MELAGALLLVRMWEITSKYQKCEIFREYTKRSTKQIAINLRQSKSHGLECHSRGPQYLQIQVS
jgi:hypothetical protein